MTKFREGQQVFVDLVGGKELAKVLVFNPITGQVNVKLSTGDEYWINSDKVKPLLAPARELPKLDSLEISIGRLGNLRTNVRLFQVNLDNLLTEIIKLDAELKAAKEEIQLMLENK